MSVYEKLAEIQQELKCPKDKYNSFGKYNFRSCEGIFEAVKPLLKKYQVALVVTDTVEDHNGASYINACAKLINLDLPAEFITANALAREETDKKGMDSSQMTGTASSYARKYALNGLFLLDDTKDPDTNEYHEQRTTKQKKEATKKEQAEDLTENLMELAELMQTKQFDLDGFYRFFRVKNIAEMGKSQIEKAIEMLKDKPKKEKNLFNGGNENE